MKVSELIEELKRIPQTHEVYAVGFSIVSKDGEKYNTNLPVKLRPGYRE